MPTEKEASQLSDTEFKAMVIRKLTELSDLTENYQKLQGNYNEFTVKYIKMKKEIETINKGQDKMNNTISELKNTVEGTQSRLDEAEDWISELEDKVEKNTQKEQEKEKRLRKKEEGLMEMQDNMKCNSIRVIGKAEGEEEEQGIEKLFEKVMMENFPNLIGEKVTQIQESQSPNQEETKEAYCKTHHN